METEEGVCLEDASSDDKKLFGDKTVLEKDKTLEEREVPEEGEFPAQLPEERRRGQASFDPETFRQLILSCLQGALAMVQDPDPESQRPTERINLLLALLSPDSPHCE